VDVQEVRKLDAYLKRLFGNARIRVVPKKDDAAEVFSTRTMTTTSAPTISR
jgi:hypothetical protein